MIDESWYKRPPGVSDRTSAGGIVARIEDGRIYVALVGELGLTERVLPKGGVEPGESLEAAARREIEEEAGLSSLELIEELGIRARLSYDRVCWITTHYFLFVTEQVEGIPNRCRTPLRTCVASNRSPPGDILARTTGTDRNKP